MNRLLVPYMMEAVRLYERGMFVRQAKGDGNISSDCCVSTCGLFYF